MGAAGKSVLAVLALFYLSAAFASVLAPEDPTTQHRDLAFQPPTRLHFVDAAGQVHLRPFVYRLVARSETSDDYVEDQTTAYPVRFFVRGHVFSTDSPTRLFLLGTDDFGRDVFSRLLYGGRISLFAGLLGTGIALTIAILLGALAGYYGGWTDEAIMRVAEVFLALPWLYLLLAVRMALPLRIEPVSAFLLILVVLGVIGWARPARLIRGAVLSARTQDYVVAARCLGASDAYLLRRHVFPQVLGIVFTQAAILAPQFILAEVTLSFLGLGVGEPVPSWGNMLASVQRYHVLASYWWMFAPGLALVPVFLFYYVLADALHQRALAASI